MDAPFHVDAVTFWMVAEWPLLPYDWSFNVHSVQDMSDNSNWPWNWQPFRYPAPMVALRPTPSGPLAHDPGEPLKQLKHAPCGTPFALPAGDADSDGDRESTDDNATTFSEVAGIGDPGNKGTVTAFRSLIVSRSGDCPSFSQWLPPGPRVWLG